MIEGFREALEECMAAMAEDPWSQESHEAFNRLQALNGVQDLEAYKGSDLVLDIAKSHDMTPQEAAMYLIGNGFL